MADDILQLPEVLVTPEEQKPNYINPPHVQDYTADLRAIGTPWDDINSHLQGFTPQELGYQDPANLKNQLDISAARNKALDQVPKPDDLTSTLRQTYADAMVTGGTLGPDHFSDLYHSTDHPPIEGMAAQLPSHEDLTDHAQAILADAELPLNADFTRQVKANLLDTWAETGIPPNELYAAAINNPALSDALTSPPPPPPAPPEPEKQSGLFDPLMHGVAAVANLFELPKMGGQAGLSPLAEAIGTKEFAQTGKGFLNNISEIAEGLKAIPSEAAKQAEGGPTPLATRLTKEKLDQALNIALGFSPASIGENIVNTFFRTHPQVVAAAEKAKAKAFVQGTIREQTGLARLQSEQTKAALEEYRGDINKALPEYTEWLQQEPAARVGQPVPMIANLNAYMEGRSTGAQLDPKSPFAAVANSLRDVYTSMRQDIETNYPDLLNSFYEDYVRHSWVDPAKADRLFLGGGRMGSNASTKMRSIPTMSDGLEMGLIPVFPDPLDNAIHYVTGMNNFKAQQEILRLGREHGYVKYSASSAPEEGWVALKGRSSEKMFPMDDGTVGTMTAYAHPGYAGSYNNWVGKGFYEYPALGKIYDKLQYTANMLTGLKLAMSAYHAFNIAQETAVAGLANGIGEISHGELAAAMKDILPSITILPQAVKQVAKGAQFQRQYLGIQDYGPEMQQLVDLFARSGGRASGTRQALIGQDNAMTHAFDVWNPSKWRENAQREFNDLKFAARPNPDNTALVSGLLKTGRIGAEVGSWIGQTMGGVVKPLFENAIPKIKNAAFADEMSAWLRQNPMASKEAQLQMGRRLVDSMDDRFGELVQDNLFWPRWVKQSLNLATISVGWEFGTLRAFGGAAGDIAKGELLSPRARWLYSFPLTMAVMGSTYQYLKTGTLPTQTDTPIHDLIAPRTGGTVTYGKATYPERAQLPGYQKDPEQFYFALRNAPDIFHIPPAIGNIAFNKLSPMWRIGYGMLNDKDPFTGNVLDEHPGMEGWKDYGRWVVREAAPIATVQERMQGTAMGTLERTMGLRPAGENLSAPEAAQGYQQFLVDKAQKEARQARAAHEKKLEQPATEAVQPPQAPPPATQVPETPPNAPAASPRASRSHHNYDESGKRKY